MPEIKLEAWKYELRLNEPFKIAFHTFTHLQNVLVKLKYGSYDGWGEAAPFPQVTGDSQHQVLDELSKLDHISLDPETSSISNLHRFLDDHLSAPTARTALDFAWHDLTGKIKNLPVHKLYHQKLHTAPESYTLGIKTPPESGAEAKKVAHLYPQLEVLKIKLAGDEQDIERAEHIRAALPRDMRFMIDANQGFADPAEAVRILQRIGDILGSVILVEEPLSKGDLDGMREVTSGLSNMLVFADESAVDLADTHRIIETKAADGINIKLQKAGGIYPGKKMAEAADAAGLKVMVGCMLESSLAITAGVHFTSCSPNVVVTDLSADLLAASPAGTCAEFRNGKRIPPDLPGLGFTFDQQKLNEMMQHDDLIMEQVS